MLIMNLKEFCVTSGSWIRLDYQVFFCQPCVEKINKENTILNGAWKIVCFIVCLTLWVTGKTQRSRELRKKVTLSTKASKSIAWLTVNWHLILSLQNNTRTNLEYLTSVHMEFGEVARAHRYTDRIHIYPSIFHVLENVVACWSPQEVESDWKRKKPHHVTSSKVI